MRAPGGGRQVRGLCGAPSLPPGAGGPRWGVVAKRPPPPRAPRPALIQRLPSDVAGEGVVAGHAVGLPGEGWPLPPAPPQGTEAGQGGQKGLAEVGGDQVVEDRVDGRADVEERVGQHVEVVVEVVEEPGRAVRERRSDRHGPRGRPRCGLGTKIVRTTCKFFDMGMFHKFQVLASLQKLEVLPALPLAPVCGAGLWLPCRARLHLSLQDPWPALCRVPACQGCRERLVPGLH